MRNTREHDGKRKVLLASHHASRRGSAISLVELGVRLPQQGFDPIFVFSKPGPLADDLVARGFVVYRVARHGLLRLNMIRRLLEIIHRHGIDLVHVNSAVAFSKYVGLAAWLLRRPLVWHIREPVEDKRMTRQRPWIRRLADRVVVLTRQQAEFLDVPQKIRRVFNGVDLAHFQRRVDQASAKRSLGYAEDEFLFVQIGSIERNKGQLRSVQALARILPDRPQSRLLIVGAVVESAEAAAISETLAADERLSAAVRLIGETGDVRTTIWAADCLLLPSLRESFPRTVMEALAGGIPVVASAVGAVPEMIEHGVTGLLVSPGDVAGLAAAMGDLAGAGAARKKSMRVACAATAEAFSIENHVAAIAALYDELVLPSKSTGKACANEK